MLQYCLSCLLLTSLLVSTAIAEQYPAGPHFEPTDKTILPDADWPSKPFTREATEIEADLVVIVNQQFYEFLSPTIAGYARQNGLNILVKKGTCGLAAGAVVNKTAEITSFCCPPGKLDRLPGLSFHTLGIYPVSILVHPDNPVNELNWQQVQKIFQGKIQRWSEIGGSEEMILPIARLHCKKRPGHWRLLLDHEELFSLHIQEVGSIDDMYALVKEHSEAIGYEVAEGYHSHGTKSLRISGMDPKDLSNLRSGAYPFYRVLNMTLWETQKNDRQLVELFNKMVDYVEKYGRERGLIPAGELRANGWQFAVDELIGTPAKAE